MGTGKPGTVPLTVRLARGRRPRGCRAPARRVLGRRVRYVIGSEAGQVNGMRWRRAPRVARDR
ncbi:tryptophan biosynthesis modulator TrpM [Lentzea albida]|uniref:tryptophan biosynthesis modulator TrpM n=1 Tax=Lentzea sp. HUAS12 TaxID=2951806 RepID=UPI000B268CBC